MTTTASASVHASAVRVENRAVLIRGPSGAGKSHLAFDLILAGRSGQLPSAMLVGDDRVHLEASNGQVVVRPARELTGLIEIRALSRAVSRKSFPLMFSAVMTFAPSTLKMISPDLPACSGATPPSLRAEMLEDE